MKKQLTFTNLEGTMYTYVKSIYRQNKTRDNEIITLNQAINEIIMSYASLPASKENCMELWKALTTTFKNAEITDKKSLACKELISEIDKIGYSIAYITPRKGLKTVEPDDLNRITFNKNFTDTEKIEAIKTYILHLFNYACEKNVNVNDIDYDYYLTITDEELLDYYNERYNLLPKKEMVYLKQ